MLNWIQPDLILTRTIMELNRYFRAELENAFELIKSSSKPHGSQSKSDVILESEISFDVESDRRKPQ